MNKINGRDIVSLKNKLCDLFSYNDWMDLGYITDCIDLVQGHPRLLQSIDFHDNDYERNILEVLKQIIDRDEGNIKEVEDLIDEKYPSGPNPKPTLINTPFVHSFPAPLAPPLPSTKAIAAMPHENTMDVFISHSSQDTHAAKLLIDLIKTAFNLPAKKIRCTSVNGYRLPAGASTDEQLKKEVHESKVLIAIVSPSSMDSTYVLFELGARWATSLPLIPLVTNKLGTQLLKGPLSGINALNLSDLSQVHQLINDLGDFLEMPSESPAVYQEKADGLIEFLLKDMLPVSEPQPIRAKNGPAVDKQVPDRDVAIKSYCEKQWPDDFSMRMHCIKEQKNSYVEMQELKPSDIPTEIFEGIVKKAVHEWPEDYTMQVHSKEEQMNAFRELRNM